MASCPSCGKELPGEFPFCPFCGAALTEGVLDGVSDERKVVTVLFCDLVGFTAASESADPEDVKARLRPYHARLREEIEHYGGTVEKFVGDAVMAAFGAPVAHEDDSERAVRAGLRILEAIAEMNEAESSLSLQVRIGISTGEAIVALTARPERGEGFVTGDVVNTASRLQGAAPVNGVAVSEQTYRATERVFEYERMEPVELKGKTGRFAIWRPLAARARFGADVTRSHGSPLFGRELEKPLLIGTFERAAQQRSCQLVSLVGEPGVGKSRLCAELLGYVEDRPGLVRWRQGRCLPYGEGVSFWALGEVVKAECGILESDSPAEAEDKLEGVLSGQDSDRAWLKARLAPLVGVPAEPASQEELFTAWRLFLGSLAAERETVLVFEDLHWADLPMLAFLEHLAEWSEGVPLLVLCTARPELYEQHPTFGVKARNVQRINLAPLTDQDTARLIAALLDRAVLPAETQQLLLERAGGNPLFAEEFARLLADSGAVGVWDEVPDSVQALIAARLDTLTPDHKALLQDASVVGKVFWAGALAEMGDREIGEVGQALHDLSRNELLRPVRRSSIEGDQEYGFWHGLVRDVTYSQIPRGSRAARHLAVAAWLERQAGDRVEDLADVLADHYVTALDLARSAGQPAAIDASEAGALRYLALAGSRALALDPRRAELLLVHALTLAPAGHVERPRLLECWAKSAQQLDRNSERKAMLEEALALYRADGDMLGAGRVLTALASALFALGEPGRVQAIADALELLERQPPGSELVDAYAQLAGVTMVSATYSETIAAASRALQLAAELGLPEPADALGYRGVARASLGQREGLEDIRRTIELAIEQEKSGLPSVSFFNLSSMTLPFDGPEAALKLAREGVAFSRHRGNVLFTYNISALLPPLLAALGRTEEALVELAQLGQSVGRSGGTPIMVRSLQLRLNTLRGEGSSSVEDGDRLLADARSTGVPQTIVHASAAAVTVFAALGEVEKARVALVELGRVPHVRGDVEYAVYLPELIRGGLAAEAVEPASRLLDGFQAPTPLADHAAAACTAQIAEAEGRTTDAARLYADAAERWQTFGDVPERAHALLGQGRCTLPTDQPSAALLLREAGRLFTALGYKPALAQTEKLLASSELAAS